MRGVGKPLIEKFINSEIGKFYFKHKHELFLGVRNDYINLYYKSASIAKISVVSKELNCIIAKKYLDPHASSGYQVITQSGIIEQYPKIKKNIDSFYAPNEKTAQQRLIINNNSNPFSNWVCIDMEYVKQRHSREDDAFGRFDIIAVSKNIPRKVALIELKYGNSAIGGASGILKHTQDYLNFIGQDVFKNHLLREITSIIESHKTIDSSFPLPLCDEKDFYEKPDIYFITLDNQNDRARRTMKKYVRSGAGCSKHNIYTEIGIDITSANDKGYTPTFLFSEDNGANIFDILDDSLYTKGL